MKQFFDSPLKRFLIPLIIFLFLFLVFLFTAFLNLGSLVNQQKETILSQAESQLGRKVSVDSIDVSIWDGLGIHLKNIAVADDPAFSDKNFIRSADARINVSWMPLLQRKLQINQLILGQPEILLIINEKGQYNFSSLGQKKESPEKGTKSKESSASPSMVLSYAEIVDGNITIQNQLEKKESKIQKINITAKNLILDQKMQIALSAAALAEKKNISYKGSIGPVGNSFDFKTLPMDGNLEITNLSIDALEKSIPALKDAIPKELGLSGLFNIKTNLSGKGGELTLSQTLLETTAFGEKKPNLKFSGKVSPIGNQAKPLSVNGDFSLDPVSMKPLLAFPLIAKSLPPELSGDGPISLKGKVSGSPDSLSISLNLTASNAAVKYSNQFSKPAGMPFLVQFDGRPVKNGIEIKNSVIKLHTLDFSGNGTIQFDKNPSVKLAFKSGKTNLDGWDKIFPASAGYNLSGNAEIDGSIQGEISKDKFPVANGTVNLDKVAIKIPQCPAPLTDIKSQILFGGNSADIKELSVRIGKSQIHAVGKISKISPLTAAYTAESPEIWPSDFSAAAQDNKDVIQNLKLEGNVETENNKLKGKSILSSPKGILGKSEYTNLQANLTLDGNLLKVDNYKVQAFGGTMEGSGAYDYSEPVPKFTLISKNQSIDLTSLLGSTLASAPKNVKGKLNCDMTMSGKGKNWQEIKSALSGEGAMEVKDAAMLDVNIAQNVLSGLSGLAGFASILAPNLNEKYPKLFQTQNTSFNEMKSNLAIKEGKINFNNMVASSSDWSAKADGWFDLNQTLSSLAQLTLSPQLSQDLAQMVPAAQFLINDEGKMEIPFQLSGNLPGVKPKPDLSFIGRKIQQSFMKKGTNILQNKTGQPGNSLPQIKDNILDNLKTKFPIPGKRATSAPRTSTEQTTGSINETIKNSAKTTLPPLSEQKSKPPLEIGNDLLKNAPKPAQPAASKSGVSPATGARNDMTKTLPKSTQPVPAESKTKQPTETGNELLKNLPKTTQPAASESGVRQSTGAKNEMTKTLPKSTQPVPAEPKTKQPTETGNELLKNLPKTTQPAAAEPRAKQPTDTANEAPRNSSKTIKSATANIEIKQTTDSKK